MNGWGVVVVVVQLAVANCVFFLRLPKDLRPTRLFKSRMMTMKKKGT